MDALKKIEDVLSEWFGVLPKLPNDVKDLITKAWPWLALVFGIIQLWAALVLYHLASTAGTVINYVNSVAANYGVVTSGPTSFDRFVIYLGVVLLLVDGLLLLMAFPALRKHQRRGWELVFLTILLNVLYAVIQLFTLVENDFALGKPPHAVVGQELLEIVHQALVKRSRTWKIR